MFSTLKEVVGVMDMNNTKMNACDYKLYFSLKSPIKHTVYDHARMHAQSEDLDIIFDHMNVQHFGHAVAYLTLVYTVKERRMSHVEPCVWFSDL